MKYTELTDLINLSESWNMYGSGIVAYNTYVAIQKCLGLIPNKILVTDVADKEKFFDKNSIYCINSTDIKRIKSDPVLVATPSLYHNDIRSILKGKGFDNIILIDDRLFYEIMKRYFEQYTDFQILDNFCMNKLVQTSKRVECKVYMAKWHGDKRLLKDYKLYNYIEPIQVGAVLSDNHCINLTDCEGDNISKKNPNYCELTATYWVWKNTVHDVKGICHYRRILCVDEKEIQEVFGQGIDVILPLPYICKNSTKDQYSRYISDKDINNMFIAIKETYPEWLGDALHILEGKQIYNYNILIARKKVFDDYCEWLFGVLEHVEQYCDPNGIRHDRYAGYLGELLTTIYFIRNRKTLNVVHSDRVWMV